MLKQLWLENALLRQQVALLMYKRRRRVRLTPWQRFKLALLTLVFPSLRSALFVVKPATLVKWHRSMWSLLWALRSRERKGGRPPTPAVVIAEVKRMASAHHTWGAHRIKNELAKLSIKVSVSTVQRHMPKRGREPSRTWAAFIHNQSADIHAIDFFAIPTLTMDVLYGGGCPFHC